MTTLAALLLLEGVAEGQPRWRPVPEARPHEVAEEKPYLHVDLGLGYAYALNGFIVPAPLVGGLEDGHGLWAHLGLHPASAEWVEFNIGIDYLSKGHGNHSWGLHAGAVLFHDAQWIRLGLGIIMGYHGERRTLTLSLEELDTPETIASFIIGPNPVIEVPIVPELLSIVTECEIGFAPPNDHRYWEWEVVCKGGMKFEF